jgi:hypothetical protein
MSWRIFVQNQNPDRDGQLAINPRTRCGALPGTLVRIPSFSPGYCPPRTHTTRSGAPTRSFEKREPEQSTIRCHVVPQRRSFSLLYYGIRLKLLGKLAPIAVRTAKFEGQRPGPVPLSINRISRYRILRVHGCDRPDNRLKIAGKRPEKTNFAVTSFPGEGSPSTAQLTVRG